eukprot:TRINITY_DN4744_c0_g1_i1.p1 TRINITY_DN4744_c0_g1~~TRINITY_DN4744_c0_g1_i1.p1  ORF type:complete len:316 (-),score=55.65 TRINITY_DN4744_c0_g1_i1:55-1002(-)
MEDKVDWSKLFDTHCHVQQYERNLERIKDIKVGKIVVMGVQEKDWPLVKQAYEMYPTKVIPSFGAHPWISHRLSPKWEETLLSYLTELPNAKIGEIGLDFKRKTYETGKVEKETQVQVFKTQIAMAYKLNRPVSVHCVQAQGAMYDFFRGEKLLPPRIAFHSFSGPADMIVSFTKIPKIGKRFFFGFSLVNNLIRLDRLPKLSSSDKTPLPSTPSDSAESEELCECVPEESLVQEEKSEGSSSSSAGASFKVEPKSILAIKGTPQNRILLESDRSKVEFLDHDMLEVLKRVSDIRAWNIDEALEITQRNAEEFYS